MSLMVFSAAVDYLKEKKSGCIATIVRRIGSAPRREGATMFVGEDGKIFGTIGGGVLEKDVKEKAGSVIREKRPMILNYRMDAKSVEENGMLCGGNVDVFIEPALYEHLLVYEEARRFLSERKEGTFYVRMKDERYLKSFIGIYGSVIGDPIEEEELSRITGMLPIRKPIFTDGSSLLIPLQTKSVLYIFGAGHVARYLTIVANLVDFAVTVIDDSEELAKKENFPDAERVYSMPFEESFRILDFTGEEFVVIATKGHKTDTLCLEEVLKRPFRYVGMIGSRRKVMAVFDYLRNKGFEEEKLKKVHAPIGIEINSDTPQEVAISIVAELIKERGAYFKGNDLR